MRGAAPQIHAYILNLLEENTEHWSRLAIAKEELNVKSAMLWRSSSSDKQ